MLIAQISDTHIAERGHKTLDVAPMEENLARVIDHINHLTPPPDVVLLSGDVTNDGTAAQMANAARLLANLKFPYFVIPGNHDNRKNMWSVFHGASCPSESDLFINYVIEDFDVRIIGVDSTKPHAGGGELCDTQLDWLETQLSEHPARPTVIFMHHPPIKCSVLETDVDGFIGAERLGELVDQYPNIERIICGHIHLTCHSRWHGSIVSTAPSIGMRLSLDLTMKEPSAFFLDNPAYQLHHWTAQACLISHTISLGKVRGPYLYEQCG